MFDDNAIPLSPIAHTAHPVLLPFRQTLATNYLGALRELHLIGKLNNQDFFVFSAVSVCFPQFSHIVWSFTLLFTPSASN